MDVFIGLIVLIFPGIGLGLLGAIILCIAHRFGKTTNSVAFSDYFMFVKDKQGRILRKARSFRNTLALVIFAVFSLGSIYGLVFAVKELEWEMIFSCLSSVLFFGGSMVYLWRLRRAPKLTFDASQKTFLYLSDGQEQQLPFDQITGIKVSQRPMTGGSSGEYPNHSHFDLKIRYGTGGSIPIATFSGANKTTSKKAAHLAALLEKLVFSEKPGAAVNGSAALEFE